MISSEREMYIVKKQMNRIFRVLLTLVIPLGLLPGAAAAAGAAITVDSVAASAVNVTPALGKAAVIDGTDVTITVPADLPVRVDPDRSGHYWRYSADGAAWTNYYASDNEPFKQGYWECRLNFWIDSAGSIQFGDTCTVTMNDTLWSCTVDSSGKLLYARSPVYVLDGSGALLEEINSVSMNCETFPTLFTAGKGPAAPGDYVTTEGYAVMDESQDVWQVREGDTWRDLAAAETCVGGSAYRLKTKLTLPENLALPVTLGRDVALTVNGNVWTVDHTSMENRSSTKASVTVYSHTVYAANEVCTITFYDVNKPSGQNVVGTLEVPGGQYTLPECTFPSSHKDIIFDYWEWEDIDGTDVKKQPGETILLLKDSTIYLYWSWKPGVNRVIFDLAVSESYTYGIKADAFSLTLEGDQNVTLAEGGYGHSYWIECDNEKIDPDTTLSTTGNYRVAVHFRLEDGFMASFTENSVTLDSDVLGELACRIPIDQDDGSYIAYFSLPHIPGTPIRADKVTFDLTGYEAGKMVQAIGLSVSTEQVSFYGNGYGKASNGCAYLIYQESDTPYVYQEPVYDSVSFWASTDYWLDILFTLEDGCSLPDSFRSDGSLVKEKFVLSGIEGAQVVTVSSRAYGYYIRFKLPQLGNEPIGGVRVTLDGYEAGTMAQDVVVTVSENINPFRYTPQEHYINQHYFFCDPDNENQPVDAYTTLREDSAYSFSVWLNLAKGYDAAEMTPADIVISTPYGDRAAKAIERGLWESSYKVTFDLPKIGLTNPSYAVTIDPGEGIGTAFHKPGYYAGTSYILPDCEKEIAFTAPEGMKFKAWSVNGKEMQPGDKVTVTGYTLVTALWRPYTSVTVTKINVQSLGVPTAGAALAKQGIHKGTTADGDVYRIATRSWYDVTAGKTMAEGDLFVAGNTYRYTFTIVLKEPAYDQFASSAEEISVTVAGANEITKKFNPSGTTMMCNAFFVCKAVEPEIDGSVTLSGTTATASVTVEGMDGAGAILIVAQYSGGQMKAARQKTIIADCIVIPEAFEHSVGCTYKAFLLGAGTYAPLCAAAALTE